MDSHFEIEQGMVDLMEDSQLHWVCSDHVQMDHLCNGSFLGRMVVHTCCLDDIELEVADNKVKDEAQLLLLVLGNLVEEQN